MGLHTLVLFSSLEHVGSRWNAVKMKYEESSISLLTSFAWPF